MVGRIDVNHVFPPVPAGIGTGRLRLTSATTYLVNGATGSDTTGTGAAGAPFAQIQKALNVIQGQIDLGGQAVTISVADWVGNTYSAFSLSGPFVGGNNVTIQGNTTTPSNVTVAGTIPCLMTNYGTLAISGLKLQGTGQDINLSTGALLNISGSCEIPTINSQISVIVARTAQMLISAGPTIISGGGTPFGWLLCSGQAFFQFLGAQSVSVTGGPVWGGQMFQAQDGSVIEMTGVAWGASAATGNQAFVDLNSVLNAGGTANAIPGTAGTLNGPGQYS